jgi:hypothetical protein
VTEALRVLPAHTIDIRQDAVVRVFQEIAEVSKAWRRTGGSP